MLFWTVSLALAAAVAVLLLRAVMRGGGSRAEFCITRGDPAEVI